MSLRNRILLASGVLIVAPLLLLAVGIRNGMEQRLTAQYTERVVTLMAIIEEDLASRRGDLAARLGTLKQTLVDDNRFRLAVVENRDDLRPYLLGYCGSTMQLMGLDMLQIQDAEGRILSSGHFRNEYGRLEPALPYLLARSTWGAALVSARSPAGTFLALARADSLRLGGQWYRLIGGFAVDEEFLAGLTRDRALAVSVVHAGGALSSDPRLQAKLARIGRAGLDRPELTLGTDAHLVRAVDLPLAVLQDGAAGRLTSARLIVSHPTAPLQALLRSLHLWLQLIVMATIAGTLVLAFWLASRISSPLRSLAEQTSRLDLDNLDATFPTDRRDEVGTLGRFLAAMTQRLRSSVSRLREAERRATLGELARQINHDIRNGLAPLRNVVRHLVEVHERNPEELGDIFQARRSTLESGLSYLGDLAANYARLSTRPRRLRCDLNALVRDVTRAYATLQDQTVLTELATDLPSVLADPTGLRRIVENLVRNAVDSLSGAAGTVTVTTSSDRSELDSTDAESGQWVKLAVQDTGCGIPQADLDHIFTDFFTTKAEGTGLGLSIVRRLVADCEGEIKVSSEQDRGTTFTVILPASVDIESDTDRAAETNSPVTCGPAPAPGESTSASPPVEGVAKEPPP